jgi:hypothetical protein
MAQPQGIAEPLWCTVNKDYKFLEHILTEDIPDLFRKIYTRSVAFFQFEQNKASSDSVAKRTEELEEAITAVSTQLSNLQSTLGRIRSALLAFVISADEVPSTTLQKLLDSSPFQFYCYHEALDHGNKVSANPYSKYENMIDKLKQKEELLLLSKFLHTSKPLQLAISLFEHTKGRPVKDLTSLPNWPGLWKCFRVIDKMIHRLSQAATDLVPVLCEEELAFYKAKLQVCKAYLFNNPEIRNSSKASGPVGQINFDITPYLLKEDSESDLLVDFLSPADYSIEAFRNIVQSAPYRIGKVEGDGNCFFRAGTNEDKWVGLR